MADKVLHSVAYESTAAGILNGDIILEDPMQMWLLGTPIANNLSWTHTEILANNVVLGQLTIESGIYIPKKGVEFDEVDGTPGIIYISQNNYPISYMSFEKLKDANGKKVKIKFKKHAVLIVAEDAPTNKRIFDTIIMKYIRNYAPKT
jgi:hypothetical protein